MPDTGGKLIDTARGYGSSEEVIGKLLAELGNRDKFFLATKTPLAGDISGGKAVLDESFRRLQVSKIDLLQIHNFLGLNELMPHYIDYKQSGKIRYIGVTHVGRQPVRAAHRRDGNAQARLHPGGLFHRQPRRRPSACCRWRSDKGIAVLINVPFGGRGRSFFPRVAGKPVPDFAKEFDATTWAQFFIKYIISQSGRDGDDSGHDDGRLSAKTTSRVDAAQCRTQRRSRSMEEFWDAMPA